MCCESEIEIIYTNWKGVTARRTIVPLSYVLKESSWHGEGKHHILEAIDVEKGESRDFLLRDVKIFDISHMTEEHKQAMVSFYNSRHLD